MAVDEARASGDHVINRWSRSVYLVSRKSITESIYEFSHLDSKLNDGHSKAGVYLVGGIFLQKFNGNFFSRMFYLVLVQRTFEFFLTHFRPILLTLTSKGHENVHLKKIES